MATYTLDEVMAPSTGKTYSLDEVVPQKKPSLLEQANNIAKLAYRATPLGIASTANDLGAKLTDIERNYLGDKTLELTNSPAAATAAYMAPDIANLAVGNRVAALPFNPSRGNEAAQAAARINYKPTLPQATKSRDLNNIYDTMANMPGSAGVIARHEANNQAAINAAAAKAIGQKSDSITGDVLANATDELGNVRNALRNQVNIPKGEPTIVSAIDDASNELKKSLKNTGKFKGDMERIKQGIATGNISGEQYQIWRTDLRDEVDTAYKAGRTKLAEAYKKVLTSLDEAARSGAGEAWKANDKQFSTLNMLQNGNIINPISGDVSAPLLTNQFYREFGKSAKQGKLPGEISDIATITKGYPALKEGSATARRQNYDSVVPWAMAPFNYMAGRVLTSSPYDMLRLSPYVVPASAGVQGLLGQLPEMGQ
jgi:hypothetical protein